MVKLRSANRETFELKLPETTAATVGNVAFSTNFESNGQKTVGNVILEKKEKKTGNFLRVELSRSSEVERRVLRARDTVTELGNSVAVLEEGEGRVPVKRRRGRPRAEPLEQQQQQQEIPVQESPRRPSRGIWKNPIQIKPRKYTKTPQTEGSTPAKRPKISEPSTSEQSTQNNDSEEEKPQKRQRGRPRKTPQKIKTPPPTTTFEVSEESQKSESSEFLSSSEKEEEPAEQQLRKRGRPRKVESSVVVERIAEVEKTSSEIVQESLLYSSEPFLTQHDVPSEILSETSEEPISFQEQAFVSEQTVSEQQPASEQPIAEQTISERLVSELIGDSVKTPREETVSEQVAQKVDQKSPEKPSPQKVTQQIVSKPLNFKLSGMKVVQKVASRQRIFKDAPRLNYPFQRLVSDVKTMKLPNAQWKIKVIIRDNKISAVRFTNKQEIERCVNFEADRSAYDVIIDNELALLVGSPSTVDSSKDIEVLLDIVENLDKNDPILKYWEAGS